MFAKFCTLMLLCAGVGADDAIARQPGPFPEGQKLKNPIETSEQSLKAGKQVYERLCITCHAKDGKGVEAMADTLPTVPSDLTDNEWKYGKTDGEIFTIVRDGTTTGMEPFGAKIREQRLWHLVNYLKSFNPESGIEAIEEEVMVNPIEANAESVRKGRYLYENHCSICHGDDGSGYTDYLEFLETAPADFRGKLKYGTSDADLFKVIRDGTEYDMEAFGETMTTEHIWHTVNYIRRFMKK